MDAIRSEHAGIRRAIICACCGSRSAANNAVDACKACGARRVGEPLPKPEHELPSYARALLLSVMGFLLIGLIVTQTIIALVQRQPLSFTLWSWGMAAEAAAWRLKWLAIPIIILVLWSNRRLYLPMLQTPFRFCGLAWARRGLMASILVCVSLILLIGISIPRRLQRRQWAIEAGYNAPIYRFQMAMLEYRIRFNTHPSDVSELKRRLPDPDGSLAAALLELDGGTYKATGPDLAALPSKSPRNLSGGAIRNASIDLDSPEALPTGFSLTNYELLLPGPDKIIGTDDDLIVRDGLITKASEAGSEVSSSTASSGATKH